MSLFSDLIVLSNSGFFFILKLIILFVCVFLSTSCLCPCVCTCVSVSPFFCVFCFVLPPCVWPMKQTTDDMVSSAECSSDDEDLEECDSGRAGGLG